MGFLSTGTFYWLFSFLNNGRSPQNLGALVWGQSLWTTPPYLLADKPLVWQPVLVEKEDGYSTAEWERFPVQDSSHSTWYRAVMERNPSLWHKCRSNVSLFFLNCSGCFSHLSWKSRLRTFNAVVKHELHDMFAHTWIMLEGWMY